MLRRLHRRSRARRRALRRRRTTRRARRQSGGDADGFNSLTTVVAGVPGASYNEVDDVAVLHSRKEYDPDAAV